MHDHANNLSWVFPGMLASREWTLGQTRQQQLELTVSMVCHLWIAIRLASESSSDHHICNSHGSGKADPGSCAHHMWQGHNNAPHSTHLDIVGAHPALCISTSTPVSAAGVAKPSVLLRDAG